MNRYAYALAIAGLVFRYSAGLLQRAIRRLEPTLYRSKTPGISVVSGPSMTRGSAIREGSAMEIKL